MLSHILLIICIMFVSLSALADDAAAKVIKVTGAVSAEDASCAKRDLSRGSDIFKSDTITTAKDAFATLRFTDGTVLDMASASSLKISEYNYQAATPKQDKFQSELIQGGFRAITGTIGKRSPDEFSSKARLTTLTVRGSGFACGVNGTPIGCGIPLPEKNRNDPVFISVLQGGIDVTANNKTVPLDANTSKQSFQMANGEIQVTAAVLDFPKLGIRFPTPMKLFITEAKNVSTEVPLTTPPGPNQPPTGGAPSGGENTSPCGTLNAVQQALPASSKP